MFRIATRSAAASLTALLASACTINTIDNPQDSGAPTTVGDSGSGTDTGSPDAGIGPDAGNFIDAAPSGDGGTSADAGSSSDAAVAADGPPDQSVSPVDGSPSSEASAVDGPVSDALVVVGNGCSDPPANNQTPATATPYAIGTALRGCLRSGTDVNYYSYTVPMSPPKGGYVVIKLSDVGLQGTIQLATQTASDSADLVTASDTTPGGGVAHFFAAKPGATFRAVVKNLFTPPVASPETAYTLTATFNGINDPNAPNGTVATAAQISSSTPVQGYFFAGFDSTTDPPSAAWENWFKITLPVGAAGIALTNVASDVTGEVTFLDATTHQLAQQSNTTNGGNVQFDATVATAGDYYLRVQPLFIPNAKGGNPNIPVWMTQPWTLTVTPK